MNYRELEKLKKRIKAQRLIVAAAKAKAENMSSASDGMAHGCSVSDYVGSNAVKLVFEKEKLDELYKHFADSIRAIPDEYMRNIIRLRAENNWSWAKIALTIGGNLTPDGVRVMCGRYKWNFSI